MYAKRRNKKKWNERYTAKSIKRRKKNAKK